MQVCVLFLYEVNPTKKMEILKDFIGKHISFSWRDWLANLRVKDTEQGDAKFHSLTAHRLVRSVQTTDQRYSLKLQCGTPDLPVRPLRLPEDTPDSVQQCFWFISHLILIVSRYHTFNPPASSHWKLDQLYFYGDNYFKNFFSFKVP